MVPANKLYKPKSDTPKFSKDKRVVKIPVIICIKILILILIIFHLEVTFNEKIELF